MATRRLWWFAAVVLAVLAAGAAPVRGESYVELFFGGVKTANEPMAFHAWHHYPNGVSYESIAVPGRNLNAVNPAVGGGARLGTWFVREGFPGWNYPQWLRYFGCYVDISFHRLDLRPQPLDTLSIDLTPPVTGAKEIPKQKNLNRFFTQGRVVTVAFMPTVRYGFFPSEEVPFGRLQPYIAAGPGLFVMNQVVTAETRSYQAERNRFTTYTLNPEGRTAVTVCLVADAGVRWMFNRRLSLDVFFRYRYVQPTFTYQYRDPLTQRPASFSLRPSFDIYAVYLGAAYHF